MTATPEPVSPAPDTDRSALVDAVHQALQVDAITAAHVALWGDAPGWVDTTLNEMLENAVLDSVVQRVEPLLAGLRADLDRARAERDTFADLHRGEARTHDETIASLNAARAEVERLGLEIQGYQVDGPYQRGHEHGQQARQAEVDRARSERDTWQHRAETAADSLSDVAEALGVPDPVSVEAILRSARVSGARSMTTPNDLLPLLAGLLADLDRVETERDKLGREVDRLTAAGARPIPDDAAEQVQRAICDAYNEAHATSTRDVARPEEFREEANAAFALFRSWVTPTTGPAPAAADVQWGIEFAGHVVRPQSSEAAAREYVDWHNRSGATGPNRVALVSRTVSGWQPAAPQAPAEPTARVWKFGDAQPAGVKGVTDRKGRLWWFGGDFWRCVPDRAITPGTWSELLPIVGPFTELFVTQDEMVALLNGPAAREDTTLPDGGEHE